MGRIFDEIDIIFIVLISFYLIILFFTIAFWLKDKLEIKNIRLRVIEVIKSNERHKVIKVIKPKKTKKKAPKKGPKKTLKKKRK